MATSSSLKLPSLLPHHHLHHLQAHPYRRRNALPDIYTGLHAAVAMEHLRGLYTAERLGMAAAVAVAVGGMGTRRPGAGRTGTEQVNGLGRQVETLAVGGSGATGAAAAQCVIGGC